MNCGYVINVQENTYGFLNRSDVFSCRETMGHYYWNKVVNAKENYYHITRVGFSNAWASYKKEDGIIVADKLKKIFYWWNPDIEIEILGEWIYFKNYIPDNIEASFFSAILSCMKTLINGEDNINTIYKVFSKTRISCFQYEPSTRLRYKFYAYLLSKNNSIIHPGVYLYNGASSLMSNLMARSNFPRDLNSKYFDHSFLTE